MTTLGRWNVYRQPAAAPEGGPRRLRWMRPGAVDVGRGSRWASPFRARRRTTLTVRDGMAVTSVRLRPPHSLAAAELYREWVTTGLSTAISGWIGAPYTVDDIREELAGLDLVCRCREGRYCHAEVLLELANSPEDPR